MALQPPAVPEPAREAAAAAQEADAASAGPSPAQEPTPKPEPAIQQEALNKQQASTTELLKAPVLAQQPVSANAQAPDGAAANSPDDAVATATAPPTDDKASEGTAQGDSEKPSEEHSVPSILDVVCADTKGVLVLNFKAMRCIIQYKGQEMSGTEFEKAAGREKAKKWKTSVRVATADGKQGEMVGDWLARHGLDVRMSQLFKLGEARPATVRPPAAPRPYAAKPSAPRPPPPNSTAVLASASDAAILEHLDKQYIGLQQGDPDLTFDKLPKGEAVPQIQPGMQLLDLRTATHKQLMDLSEGSAENPFGELLPFNPGVLPSRLGYMTGQQPKRQKLISARDPAKALLLMRQYLNGGAAEPPWDAIGMSRPPVIAGRELDLRKFHEAVEECGGFDAAVSNKKFARIAVRLGIDLTVATNAAYLLKGYYLRLLTPYLGDKTPATQAEQSEAVTESEAVQSDMQLDGAIEPGSSLPHESGVDGVSSAVAVLDDSTIQQHSKILTARLQSQPDHGRVDGLSESETDVEHSMPLPANFKATLVDSTGPIPGLEDV